MIYEFLHHVALCMLRSLLLIAHRSTTMHWVLSFDLHHNSSGGICICPCFTEFRATGSTYMEFTASTCLHLRTLCGHLTNLHRAFFRYSHHLEKPFSVISALKGPYFSWHLLLLTTSVWPCVVQAEHFVDWFLLVDALASIIAGWSNALVTFRLYPQTVHRLQSYTSFHHRTICRKHSFSTSLSQWPLQLQLAS